MASAELKENEADDTIELWVEGEFISGFSLKEFKYQQARLQTSMLCNMLRKAVRAGKLLRSKEVLDLLTEK